jgi:hypothetical protein
MIPCEYSNLVESPAPALSLQPRTQVRRRLYATEWRDTLHSVTLLWTNKVEWVGVEYVTLV